MKQQLLERLTREQKPEAVEVLAAAFHDYPVMRYVLRTTGSEYQRNLRDLIGFFCEVRYAKDAYVIGLRKEENLVGVVLVDEAVQKRWQNLELELERLKERIGHEAYVRLERYETISSRKEPAAPHYFVGMVGVHPQHQRKGFSRILLERATKMSAEDPRSAGVCLSTEDPKNVRLYQHFGYQIVSEADIEELHSWCLFLATR